MALPQLIGMGALRLPSTLEFGVPAIPKGMMQKALWYVEHVDTHIRAFEIDRPDMPDPVVCYYVLRKDSNDVARITNTLIQMFEDAWRGKRHKCSPASARPCTLCSLRCPRVGPLCVRRQPF